MGKKSGAGNNAAFSLRLRDNVRTNLLKYIGKAFRMLPELEKPRVLDIGCGSGVPTLELARLSRGQVVGIDIDQSALDIFAERIRQAGLADRVRAINRSLMELDFPDGSFDIIWAEGSIYAVGFEKGLRDWKRFLKPGGFLVVHDEQGDVNGKLEKIPGCGYELLGSFLLSAETWKTEYFAPLEKLVDEYSMKIDNDSKIIEELREARTELEMFKKSPGRNSSVYFILKKKF